MWGRESCNLGLKNNLALSSETAYLKYTTLWFTYKLYGYGTCGIWLQFKPVLVGQGRLLWPVQHHPGARLLGQLVQHVVPLVEVQLDAEPLGDAGQRGLSGGWIVVVVGGIESEAVAIRGRKVLHPVPKFKSLNKV